jgi:hypothetical protein
MAAIAAAILIIPSAFAVENTGVFQLDGNAQQAVPAGAAGDDWDNICAKYAAAGTAPGVDVCHQAPGVPQPAATSTAEASTFITDAFNAGSDNIFKGGTDDADVSTWQWKQATPSPNKADLEQAFAAQYTVPAGAPDNPGDQVLYFGGTRYSNNGDTNIGLWFFQSQVTTGGAKTNADGSCSVSSGCGFTGQHTAGNISLGGSLGTGCQPGHNPANICTPGDIFILSAFTGGGTQPTIKAFEWVGPGKATKNYNGSNNCFTNACTLQPLNIPNTPGFTDNRCGGPAVTSIACATVNAGQIQSPWLFTDQGGAPANQIAANELYEGGLDLTGLGFGSVCFSSMLLNTRSSQSGTSVLQDFALGNFAPCGASMTTAPTAGETDATSVAPGTPVTDTATVTGTGIANPPTPTGNVTFYLCGPMATGTCDTGSASNQVGSPVALSGTGQPQGTATATSSAVNGSGSPLTPGRYCFRATWPGDSNYHPTAPATVFVETNATSECFVVRTIPTTTVTTPWSTSDASGHALTGTLALGTSLFDKAVVTGTSVGGSPPGNVNFFICDPGHLTGSSGSETCPKGTGTPLTGNPRPLSADAGSSPPTSTAFSSPAVVANQAGVWCFRAEYVHTGSTYQDSFDANHSECVTVGPENTTTTTTPKFNGGNIVGALPVGSSVTDHAVVAAIDNADGTPTGTVDFFICDPATVAGNISGNCSSGGVSAGANKPLSALAGQPTPSATADSDAVIANSVGLWCFRAVYTPGGANGANYNGSSDPAADSLSKSECFLVQDSTSMTSAQTWVPNDSATVTATGGTALNGTIDIQMYTGSCLADHSDVAVGATKVSGQDYSTHITNATALADRTFATSNSTAISQGTTVVWLVTFTPDSGTNVIGSKHCESSTLSISN